MKDRILLSFRLFIDVSQLILLLVVELNFDLPYSLNGARCTVCLYAFEMMQAFIETKS